MSFRGRLFTLILWVHVRAWTLLLYWSTSTFTSLFFFYSICSSTGGLPDSISYSIFPGCLCSSFSCERVTSRSSSVNFFGTNFNLDSRMKCHKTNSTIHKFWTWNYIVVFKMYMGSELRATDRVETSKWSCFVFLIRFVDIKTFFCGPHDIIKWMLCTVALNQQIFDTCQKSDGCRCVYLWADLQSIPVFIGP